MHIPADDRNEKVKKVPAVDGDRVRRLTASKWPSLGNSRAVFRARFWLTTVKFLLQWICKRCLEIAQGLQTMYQDRAGYGSDVSRSHTVCKGMGNQVGEGQWAPV